MEFNQENITKFFNDKEKKYSLEEVLETFPEMEEDFHIFQGYEEAIGHLSLFQYSNEVFFFSEFGNEFFPKEINIKKGIEAINRINEIKELEL